MDDSEIIALFERRDESAVEAVKEKYSAYLARTVKNVLFDDADVEECLSETYFRIWNKIPPAKPGNFALFIGKIARELAIDSYRTKTAQKRRGSEYELSLAEIGDLIPSEDTADEAVDAAFLKEKISEFLKQTPEKARRVFLRRYFFFDSVKTIAQTYGMSESSVKVTLFRTREKLRKILEKEGFTV